MSRTLTFGGAAEIVEGPCEVEASSVAGQYLIKQTFTVTAKVMVVRTTCRVCSKEAPLTDRSWMFILRNHEWKVPCFPVPQVQVDARFTPDSLNLADKYPIGGSEEWHVVGDKDDLLCAGCFAEFKRFVAEKRLGWEAQKTT